MMKYQEELIETANKLVADGKGILAADESNNTIKKRFDSVGVENTEANRSKYRSLLFNAPNLNKYISGVICYEETLSQKDSFTGKKLLETLKEKGLIVGIKVDKGLFELPLGRETITRGFDDLFERSSKFYEMGARFAKWRSVLRIDKNKNWPTEGGMKMNAYNLARYALVCQATGLVPVVEPEVLMDGDHTVEECERVTRRVLTEVFKALNEYNILLEGMLLKVNMVVPGAENSESSDMSKVASLTGTCLLRTVPAVVPGVVFLSGGQSEKNATKNLNEINKFVKTLASYSSRDLSESQLESLSKLWKLSFSYGRALQSSCLKAWKGKEENVKKAQEVLVMMARNNWLAAQGKLTKQQQNELDELTKDLSDSSLYEKDYKY